LHATITPDLAAAAAVAAYDATLHRLAGALKKHKWKMQGDMKQKIKREIDIMKEKD